MTTPPLTAESLATLLDILNDPEHPSFTQAIERLTTFDPSGLNPVTAVSLLARLQATIEKLATESKLTASQLTALRRGGTALQSYGNTL